jgi:hypothetical protein
MAEEAYDYYSEEYQIVIEEHLMGEAAVAGLEWDLENVMSNADWAEVSADLLMA